MSLSNLYAFVDHVLLSVHYVDILIIPFSRPRKSLTTGISSRDKNPDFLGKSCGASRGKSWRENGGGNGGKKARF